VAGVGYQESEQLPGVACQAAVEQLAPTVHYKVAKAGHVKALVGGLNLGGLTKLCA
jgi:hypothetical protein